jgi:hypothetical protein
MHVCGALELKLNLTVSSEQGDSRPAWSHMRRREERAGLTRERAPEDHAAIEERLVDDMEDEFHARPLQLRRSSYAATWLETLEEERQPQHLWGPRRLDAGAVVALCKSSKQATLLCTARSDSSKRP